VILLLVLAVVVVIQGSVSTSAVKGRKLAAARIDNKVEAVVSRMLLILSEVREQK
jgi:hypothetical protein